MVTNKVDQKQNC